MEDDKKVLLSTNKCYWTKTIWNRNFCRYKFLIVYVTTYVERPLQYLHIE